MGVAIKKDAGMLEGQQVTVRRFQLDGNIGYQMYFKVPEFYHADVGEAMKRLGSGPGKLKFYRGLRDKDAGLYKALSANTKEKGDAWVLDYNGTQVTFCTSDYVRAYKGYFEINVFEPDGRKAATRVRNLLKELRLDQIIDNPGLDDERLHRLSVLAWQHAPREEFLLERRGRTITQMEQFLRDRGIDPKMADDLMEKEVWPGYKTYINPGVAKEYKDAGAVNLWAGVGHEPEKVVQILESDSPGLMSTMQRYQNGVFGGGASEGPDEESGGADSSFLRLATAKSRGRYLYRSHFKGGGYRIVFDPKALERMDWYGYNGDKFGSTERHVFSERQATKEHIKTVDQHYREGNEIMFRRGIGKEYVMEVNCDTEWERSALLNEFKRVGIETINGKQVEKLVKVRQKI
jgi:hypothetical protein